MTFDHTFDRIDCETGTCDGFVRAMLAGDRYTSVTLPVGADFCNLKDPVTGLRCNRNQGHRGLGCTHRCSQRKEFLGKLEP